jgi:tetratricopeptide (TPR) repeat protein
MGDLVATERHYLDAYERAGALGDEAERAKAAYNLSFAYLLNTPMHDRAKELLEEALVILRRREDRAAIGRAAWALGAVYGEGYDRTREDYLRSSQLTQEALQQHRTLGNRFDIAWDLHSTGLAALHLGDLQETERDWREAIQIFVDAGDTSGIVLLLSDFCELARARGDVERQDTLVGAWTAMSKRTGVGLATLWGTTEGRVLVSDIPPERKPALDRGLAMTTEEAIAYALAAPPATTRVR